MAICSLKSKGIITDLTSALIKLSCQRRRMIFRESKIIRAILRLITISTTRRVLSRTTGNSQAFKRSLLKPIE